MVRTGNAPPSGLAASPVTWLPSVDAVHEAVASPDRAVAVVRGRRHLADLGPDLDALARLAARVMGTSLGLVNLVGPGTQEHLGRNNPALPTRTMLPESQMHCGHVVTTNAPLVVLDSRAEARFIDNPAVREGLFRFYVGAPVVASDGEVLGTVCALDPEPRSDVGEAELSALVDIPRCSSCSPRRSRTSSPPT
jgi:GAF domain-containing protein